MRKKREKLYVSERNFAHALGMHALGMGFICSMPSRTRRKRVDTHITHNSSTCTTKRHTMYVRTPTNKLRLYAHALPLLFSVQFERAQTTNTHTVVHTTRTHRCHLRLIIYTRAACTPLLSSRCPIQACTHTLAHAYHTYPHM